MVKVSIILPVYNVEKYLDKCMESLCNQTLKDIEIVAVNDGATDSSPEILKKYAAKDERIKIVDKPNGGLSDARNAGLEVANGQYISFIDSDDWVETNMLETLVLKAEKTGADIVMCSYLQEFDDGNSKKFSVKAEYDVIYDRNRIISDVIKPMIGLKGYYPGCFTAMESFNCVWKNLYKRELIYDNHLRFMSEREYFAEDLLFNLSAYWAATSLVILDKPLYHYRYNQASLSNKYRNNLFNMFVKKYNYISDILKSRNADADYSYLLLGRTCFEATYIVGNIFKNGNPASKAEKKKELMAVLQNPIISNAFKAFDYSSFPLKYKVFFTLIRLKCATILNLLYGISS